MYNGTYNQQYKSLNRRSALLFIMIIRTDASKCINIIQGYSFFNNGMDDFWYYSDVVFKTGRSYALVSEYQQGCMYLSYLLGGQIEIKDGQNNNAWITSELLHYVELFYIIHRKLKNNSLWPYYTAFLWIFFNNFEFN